LAEGQDLGVAFGQAVCCILAPLHFTKDAASILNADKPKVSVGLKTTLCTKMSALAIAAASCAFFWRRYSEKRVPKGNAQNKTPQNL